MQNPQTSEIGSYEAVLKRLLSCCRAFDQRAEQESQSRWDNIGKPIDGLGRLEKMISKIAGMTGSADVRLQKKAVAVLCGDHGVVEEGVTQTGQEVTLRVAENMARGVSSVCLMARVAGADVFAVDMGMVEDVSPDWQSPVKESVLTDLAERLFRESGFQEPAAEEWTDETADRSAEAKFIFPPSGRLTAGKIAEKKTAKATENMVKKPAMTREQAALAVCRGIETAAELREKGYDLIVTGEMGIGNTTAAGAAACCLCGLTPEEAVGRGAGLSDEALARKREAVRKALKLHRPNPQDPLDVLSKVGGYDLAGMTGVFLGGAVFGLPVVVDGVISAVAAVLAEGLSPGCRDFMLASHLGKEPAMISLMKCLELTPVIHGELALGEGTGGVALLPLLDMALQVYGENVTFEDIQMDAYERMS